MRRTQVRGTRAERGSGTLAVLWQTFVKENKVIPPVLAVISLLVFSWVVAGAFISEPDDPVSSNQSLAPGSDEVAQSETGDEAATSVPEIDNPNAESFAAYESKDPFRSLFTPASTEDENNEGTNGSEGTNSDGGDGSQGPAEDNGFNDDSNNGSSDDFSNDDLDEDGPRRDPTSVPANTSADAQYGEGDYSGDDIGDDRSGSGGNSGGDPGNSPGDFEGSDELFDSGGNLPNPVR